MSKRLSLLILFLGVTLAVTGCFGNTPPPEPKGDTLTQEQLNELFPKAYLASVFALGDLFNGPMPAAIAIMGSVTVKPTFKFKQPIMKASAYTPLTWTGPDNGGWYQATESATGSFTYNYTYKFRYFSSTGVYEYKVNGTETMEVNGSILTRNISGNFHGTKGSNTLWTGDFTYLVNIETNTYKFDIDFSNLSDTVTSGIIDGWFEATGDLTVSNYQYAHYIFAYDPDHAADPAFPCHLTGWHETSSNPIDMWVRNLNPVLP